MSDDDGSSSSGGGRAGGDEEVPYHLMPIAALLGTYGLLSSAAIVRRIYRSATRDETKLESAEDRIRRAPRPLKSRDFLFLVVSAAASIAAYGYVVARVENATPVLFDPYDILGIDVASNSTVAKKAYRALSKVHHPDKGGNEETFQRIHLAYRALSDPIAKENWKLYGHPDGPRTRTLSFALPDWLLRPEGTVAAVLVSMYLGMFAALIVWAIRHAKRTERSAAAKAASDGVAQSDVAYLSSNLSPESTHLDVLFCIATTPENLEVSQKAVDKSKRIRKERLEMLEEKRKEEQKRGAPDMTFELTDDDGGWADDEEDEDEAAKAAALAAKRAEERKARDAAALAQATGKAQSAKHAKLEGIDDGVLGQGWVERTLESKDMWPPKLGALEGKTFADATTGKVSGALDHPAARRNLCMTMGRLNAQMLNTHPELVAAGNEGNIDPTYFKSTMEFRQRTGLLLEAALRIAMSVRSYRLAKTVVECVSMFKIGTSTPFDAQTLDWFRTAMKDQYGGEDGIPKLSIAEGTIETPGEEEVATGDSCALILDIERRHAGAFAKQKVEACQKQGIPPQVALQTYREGWWILVRARRLDGGDGDDGDGEAKEDDGDGAEEEEGAESNPVLKALDASARRKFDDEVDENRIVTAWPFVCSNVAQKSGRVKVRFRAPDAPGAYRFYVAVKSQEFLDADQEFTLDVDVADAAGLTREEKEEEEGEEEEGEGEGKVKDRDGDGDEGEEKEGEGGDDDDDDDGEEEAESDDDDDGGESKKNK